MAYVQTVKTASGAIAVQIVHPTEGLRHQPPGADISVRDVRLPSAVAGREKLPHV